MDAVRTGHQNGRDQQPTQQTTNHGGSKKNRADYGEAFYNAGNPGGAPPLDWWHPVDATIDAVIDQRAGKKIGRTPGGSKERGNGTGERHADEGAFTVGARGVHIRRALTDAGYLTNSDFYDVSPRGYTGAHYAVWPPELVQLLIDEMCPRKVCTVCGEPSRRIVGDTEEYAAFKANNQWDNGGKVTSNLHRPNIDFSMPRRSTTGWSDCGHGAWRPGRILDPFSGSGTTLAVASGMGRDSVGIDLDPHNADLTAERVGMFLEVDYGTKEAAS